MSTLTFVQRHNTLVQDICRTLGYCALMQAGVVVASHHSLWPLLVFATLGHFLICASEVFDRPEWKSGGGSAR